MTIETARHAGRADILRETIDGAAVRTEGCRRDGDAAGLRATAGNRTLQRLRDGGIPHIPAGIVVMFAEYFPVRQVARHRRVTAGRDAVDR
ncbi:hypothetical protein ACFWQG_10540 [Rhodococcus sp. NPDC058532]|uniref:hypothetical protein n=1 Tax=Rhodococcus sp. NPDC058532 TaxID=3346540 RepID=UPI00364B14A6